MSQLTREQRIAGYRTLAELGVDVSQAMAAEGLTIPEPAEKAAARARLEILKADAGWGKRYFAGDADAVTEFESLTRAIA